MNSRMAEGVCIANPLRGNRAGRQQGRQGGFTLIEMMVTIGIMAIVLAIALPAYSAWRQSAALQNSSETLMSHIKQARIMAVSRNRSVSIAFATNAYTVDSSGSNPQQYLLSQYSKRLTMSAAFSGTPATTLTFGSDGTATSGSVTITNASGATKTIQVNLVGRTYE
jgi:type IV fimbrial biogenesis protein FimT